MGNIILPSTSTNVPAIVTSAGTALAANTSRNGFIIQNCGQNPLFVRFGGTASTSVFHIILAGNTGAADDNGTGGRFVMTDGAVFAGLVSVAGTNPRFTVFEM